MPSEADCSDRLTCPKPRHPESAGTTHATICPLPPAPNFLQVHALHSAHRTAPHLAQQRVQRVLQFHGHALQRLAAAIAAQQLQRNRLVLAIHLTRRQLRIGARQGVPYAESIRFLRASCRALQLASDVTTQGQERFDLNCRTPCKMSHVICLLTAQHRRDKAM
jgi:hypothetical protein